MKHIILYVLILAFTIISCKTNVSESLEDEHDHGAVKINLTKYSDQFELFAEADPFIIGKTTNILAHFTRLGDFKPLTEGSVRIELHVGTNGIGKTIEKPIRPGIYKFALQPEVAGKGKLIFEIKTESENHKIVIDNFMVYDDEHDAIHTAEEEEVDQINAISFTKEQSWKIDFETVSIQKDYFGKLIKSTAQILPNQNSEVIVTAKTNGLVKFFNNILEGQFVKSGETLIGISGKGLASDNIEVQYTEAKNNYELAKTNYDRKLALSQNKIVSEKEVESAKADYENAKAIYNNLKANFNSAGQSVASPQNGSIKHVFVKNGQYVEAGEELYSIVNNNKLIVNAEVQQKYYPYLSLISSFNIKSFTDNKIYTQSELNGKLLSYGKDIDEDEGYLIPVNFHIDNKYGFLPGSFVEIFIKTKSDKKALLVPNSALIEEQSNFYVFVQLSPELFEKREVKLGVSDGINSEIIAGLNGDERIISKGAIIVKLAAVSNTLDPHAGHVH
ncbi:MAG: efflux RND transporter periplasmic adaptor subunit [Bacteroidales bacterium]|nr:efflux RND transporter periplasmic adaptor subunit [Bacteroidales bacterium]